MHDVFAAFYPGLSERVADFETSLQTEYGVRVKASVALIDAQRHQIETIAQIVSSALGVPIDIMKQKTRKEKIREARQICVYFCIWSIPGVILQDVGDFFDQDHTTIINSRERIKSLIDSKDAKIMAKVDLCKQSITSKISLTIS